MRLSIRFCFRSETHGGSAVIAEIEVHTQQSPAGFGMTLALQARPIGISDAGGTLLRHLKAPQTLLSGARGRRERGDGGKGALFSRGNGRLFFSSRERLLHQDFTWLSPRAPTTSRTWRTRAAPRTKTPSAARSTGRWRTSSRASTSTRTRSGQSSASRTRRTGPSLKTTLSAWRRTASRTTSCTRR